MYKLILPDTGACNPDEHDWHLTYEESRPLILGQRYLTCRTRKCALCGAIEMTEEIS